MGYFELLTQLSKIKKCSLEVFLFYLDNIKKNNNHKIFVIEDNNKIIGNITVILEQKFIRGCKKVGHIEDVVVHKDYRGKGLTRKLLNYVINYCKKNNCYKIILDCSEEYKIFMKRMDLLRRIYKWKKDFNINIIFDKFVLDIIHLLTISQLKRYHLKLSYILLFQV